MYMSVCIQLWSIFANSVDSNRYELNIDASPKTTFLFQFTSDNQNIKHASRKRTLTGHKTS